MTFNNEWPDNGHSERPKISRKRYNDVEQTLIALLDRLSKEERGSKPQGRFNVAQSEISHGRFDQRIDVLKAANSLTKVLESNHESGKPCDQQSRWCSLNHCTASLGDDRLARGH